MDAWRIKRDNNKPSKANNGSNSTFEDDNRVMELAESQSDSLKVQKLSIKCKTRSTYEMEMEGDVDVCWPANIGMG